VTLGYFAVVDWLHMARIAGYLCIAEMSDPPLSLSQIPKAPLAGDFAPLQTAIDRDEPILSDLTNLAVDT
jgi:hypothetical protein